MKKTTMTLLGRLSLLASIATMSSTAVAQEKTIGVAVPNLVSSFWISAVYGSEDEAKKSGAKRKPNAAFMEPMNPSSTLAAVVGLLADEVLDRDLRAAVALDVAAAPIQLPLDHGLEALTVPGERVAVLAALVALVLPQLDFHGNSSQR